MFSGGVLSHLSEVRETLGRERLLRRWNPPPRWSTEQPCFGGSTPRRTALFWGFNPAQNSPFLGFQTQDRLVCSRPNRRSNLSLFTHLLDEAGLFVVLRSVWPTHIKQFVSVAAVPTLRRSHPFFTNPFCEFFLFSLNSCPGEDGLLAPGTRNGPFCLLRG